MSVPIGEGGVAGYEAGEVLEVATAIANREMRELEIQKGLMSEVTGEQPDPVSQDLQRSMLVAKTAAFMRCIEDPTYIPDPAEIVRQMDLSSIERQAQQLSEETGETIDLQQALTAVTGFVQGIFETAGFDDATRREKFSRMLGSARQVADERGVSVSAVYENDDLYIEAVSRAQTAEEFVQDVLKTANAMSEQMTNGFLVKLAEAIMPAELSAEMTKDELAEFFMEMQLDEEIQEGIAQAVNQMQAGLRHMAIANVIRIWGMDALRALPQELQDSIGVGESRLVNGRGGRVIEVGGLAVVAANSEVADTLVMREAFARSYFAERGWDLERATMEQILEVRAQPGWQNPSV